MHGQIHHNTKRPRLHGQRTRGPSCSFGPIVAGVPEGSTHSTGGSPGSRGTHGPYSRQKGSPGKPTERPLHCRPSRRRTAVTLVVDASVVVAALVDEGEVGWWAEEILLSAPLAAPQLMPYEVANVLRRAGRSGEISDDSATLAHADLLDLDFELLPHAVTAPRAWELRSNLTMYDAAYVALAELLEAPLATLDERLLCSTGPRCEFLTRPG